MSHQPPDTVWGAWPNIAEGNREQVRQVLKVHFKINFEFSKKKRGGQLTKNKKKFADAFLQAVSDRGGDHDAADHVLTTLTRMENNKGVTRPTSLCVQHPHSKQLTSGDKEGELRKRPLGNVFAGRRTRVYINESKKPSNLELHKDVPAAAAAAPGHLIGEVTFTGECIHLAKEADCTEEMQKWYNFRENS